MRSVRNKVYKQTHKSDVVFVTLYFPSQISFKISTAICTESWWTKAVLVHTGRWREVQAELEQLFPERSRREL